LAASKNPKITALSQAQRDAFALALTALTMMESRHQTKVSGTHNYAGRKGKGTKRTTKETESGVTVTLNDEEFLNFASLEDFVTDQVAYMARKFPKFYQAKTYPELIRSLYVAPTKKNPDGYMYATDLRQRGNTNNIFDPNMHTNQYAIKLANFMGMTKVGEAEEFLISGPRPDMEIIDGTWVISDKGKTGTMRSINGIRGDQYLDKKHYDVMKEGGIDLETKVLNQIEYSNEINHPEDAINADVVQYGLTREQIRNSLASNAHSSIMFQELFPDNYQVGMDFGIQDKDSMFDVSTSTTVDHTGDVTGPVDYEISGGRKGIKLYAGERGEKKYFGGQFDKKITDKVRLKGGIQKKDGLTSGKIKLEVDLP
jgi:hypothetical protein